MAPTYQLLELDKQSEEVLLDLQEGGALREISERLYRFSSPLTQRFYSKELFPSRSDVVPSSLVDLVIKAIEAMSSTSLHKATAKQDFRKEGVFQHVFMAGLSAALPPSIYICSEMSAV